MYDRHPHKPYLYWVKSVKKKKKNLFLNQKSSSKTGYFGRLTWSFHQNCKKWRNGKLWGFHQNRAIHALARSMISDVKMDFYC